MAFQALDLLIMGLWEYYPVPVAVGVLGSGDNIFILTVPPYYIIIHQVPVALLVQYLVPGIVFKSI